jgi:hypothetical protein
MMKLDVGGSVLWHCPLSMTASLDSFGQIKYGVKKATKQFDIDLETTITRMQDTDPAVFSLARFKTGEWSSHCLDFYLMCRFELGRTPVFDRTRLVEKVFAPFGFTPLSSALGAVKLYDPSGKDELLCCAATIFNSLVIGKRHESMAMFRNNSQDGNMSIASFIKLCSSFGALRNPILAEQVCGMLANGESDSLTFDRFEICALYCGFFADPILTLQSDPFLFLTGPLFDPIKAAYASRSFLSAVKDLSQILPKLFDNPDLTESNIREILHLQLRTAQIAYRSRKRGFVTVSQPTGPGEALPAPRRLRLRSELAACFRTKSEFIEALSRVPR